MRERTFGIAAMVAAVVVLAGCGAAPPAGEGTEAAARFVACLTAGGVQAKIGEDVGGMVLVRSDAGVTMTPAGQSGMTSGYGSEDVDAPEGSQALMHLGDADGSWIAVTDAGYFLAIDPFVHEVYAACEAEHPEFRQPEYDPGDDPVLRQQLADQTEAGIAFARCARDAGFDVVATKHRWGGNSRALIIGDGEGVFRALLAACPDEAAAGIAWMIDGELGFDWLAVLEDVVGPTSGGVSVQSGGSGDE